jgi:molybdopterin-guanine dinucleotide biosynthesis protein A
MPKRVQVTGIILAGGRGLRLGGANKSFLKLAGRPLLAHVIARAKPQVDALIVNANTDHDAFAAFGLPVVPDCMPGFLGPLAGILAGLAWTKSNHPEAEWLATFPNDCPFFPEDLVARLIAAARAEKALVASAASAGRHHPVFAVWSTAIHATPEEIFKEKGVRRVDAGLALFSNTKVEFRVQGVDPFFNVNTPEDLAAAERLVSR